MFFFHGNRHLQVLIRALVDPLSFDGGRRMRFLMAEPRSGLAHWWPLLWMTVGIFFSMPWLVISQDCMAAWKMVLLWVIDLWNMLISVAMLCYVQLREGCCQKTAKMRTFTDQTVPVKMDDRMNLPAMLRLWCFDTYWWSVPLLH